MELGNVAIIPARGGSKRIPKKNIKLFLGKPIIEYSIAAALKCGLFEKVIVSTDNMEIAEIAKKVGAEVPFMRSSKNSDDFAGTINVLIEVIEELSKTGLTFKNLCCLYPAAPFITSEKLQSSYKLLTEGMYDSVFPVCRFSYPIFRALQMDDQGRIQMIWPENLNKRSQDLVSAYHDSGSFYWANIEAVTSKKSLYTDNSAGIILNELEVQDIDNEIDWKLAELKSKLIE